MTGVAPSGVGFGARATAARNQNGQSENLWISEDGGEHFETLANHLPPIYAVRFGG